MAVQYPIGSFHFNVQWGGNKTGFSEVSGLSAEIEVIEYREGSFPENSAVKMPGIRKYSNIILKRGMVRGDNDFFNWFKSNPPERRDLIISALNENHEPVVTWKIFRAFPVKIEYSPLQASANEIVIETLELVHEGLEVETSK